MKRPVAVVLLALVLGWPQAASACPDTLDEFAAAYRMLHDTIGKSGQPLSSADEQTLSDIDAAFVRARMAAATGRAQACALSIREAEQLIRDLERKLGAKSAD
ncbi:hypothetical protein [Chthonobacter rhizosphaerae]|uniref:hypothetical protein n=1 Tax=Chthonobacter rhizosphaerae TaxID=2735553 RepID=UPI0015EFBFA6|nr:hypothetical protein [Chthonobacter rhizosphaerae]